MAAYRYGVKTVILPLKNKKDIEEIDPTVKENINFVFADNIIKVIDNAFVKPTKRFDVNITEKKSVALI